nr:MAG TPA: hypothetical protein [Caudoviricetes sp.]
MVFSTAVVFSSKVNRPFRSTSPFPFRPHRSVGAGGPSLPMAFSVEPKPLPRRSAALAAFFRLTCAVPLLQPCEKAVSLRFLTKMV